MGLAKSVIIADSA